MVVTDTNYIVLLNCRIKNIIIILINLKFLVSILFQQLLQQRSILHNRDKQTDKHDRIQQAARPGNWLK